MKKLLILICMMVLLVGTILGLTLYQEVKVNVVPGKINVFSPIDNNIYKERMISVNITLSDNATFKYAKYSDNGDPFVTLCRNCINYGFHNLIKKPFNDGFHRLRVLAVFESGEIERFVDFIVDSKSPKIKETSPKEGFANGDFEIEFFEENPKSIFINYGNDDIGFKNKEININDCQDGFLKIKRCSVSVDLNDYDSKEIKYWFNVTDVAKNSNASEKIKLNVDLSKPVVNSFEFTVENFLVNFSFNITEKNFESIYFFDHNALLPVWRRLCTSLDGGVCENRRFFWKGAHVLDFRITDRAGNIEMIKGVNFLI